MSEKKIEQKFVSAVKTAGGIAPKFVSPGMVGMPDRIILFPNARMAFVEVKDKGKIPKACQLKRIKKIKELGFKIYVLNEENQITTIINEVRK